MSRRAVVLAGGLGTRLRPYTSVLPKPLMPIGDAPVLEVIIRQLARDGFDHITLAVNYHAALIQAFFGDGTTWGVRLDYSLETEALSTIAPLALIRDLPDHFVLLNGDVLTDLDFGGLLDRHASEGRFFTISAAERTHTIDYGVLEAGEAGVLERFREKPTSTYLVSMGIYGVSRAVLDMVPPGRRYGFDDLMRDCLAQGRRVHVDRHTGYWLDIGRPDDYAKAAEDYATLKPLLLRNG